MFKYLKKVFHFKQLSQENKRLIQRQEIKAIDDKTLGAPLTTNLKHNQKLLQSIFQESVDINLRPLKIGQKWQTEALLIFLEGMVDKNEINNTILKPLMYDIQWTGSRNPLNNHDINEISRTLIAVGDTRIVDTIKDVAGSVLNGDSILLVEGSDQALVVSSKGWESRGVSEPKTELVVRGPREAFVESIRINTVLLRRRIQDPNLVIENFIIGKRTRTNVSLAYIKGIVKPSLIKEVKIRLNRIQTDAILESGYIEQFIEDAPFSPFATVGNTERPDVVAAKLLEGRAAIFVDGTPFVLTVPLLFVESFQVAEDYYSRPYYVSIIRNIRFISFLISVLGPAVYVALTSYHQNMLPTPLLITMAASREGTPFPSIVEALGMGIVFEILREAGIRLPRPVGQAISIVGALVIGESAVSAGIIGAPMVIVVALTAIASFVVPAYADVSAIGRIALLLLAGVLGAFGILMGLLGGLIHLASLRSFGIPYLSPFSPPDSRGFNDTLFRFPLWTMVKRPRSLETLAPRRMKSGQIPHPPKKD